MAKKPKIDNDLFAQTSTGEQELEADPVVPRGTGLKKSEWAELDAIAKEFGETSHALRMFAIRKFIADYKAGKIQPVTKKTLPDL